MVETPSDEVGVTSCLCGVGFMMTEQTAKQDSPEVPQWSTLPFSPRAQETLWKPGYNLDQY